MTLEALVAQREEAREAAMQSVRDLRGDAVVEDAIDAYAAAVVAVADAEEVEGAWVVVEPNAAWPMWGVEIPGERGIESVPDERTAIRYKNALNRAERGRKE